MLIMLLKIIIMLLNNICSNENIKTYDRWMKGHGLALFFLEAIMLRINNFYI